jgi:hypothetical protein
LARLIRLMITRARVASTRSSGASVFVVMEFSQPAGAA